ncbi:MAG: Ribose-5-phosphate isomerase B [Actinobacteria bacterium ADurb.Bin444]|nr:MAG: Ribose-5-phosphate isomerase B [Actinobacteria bacterium ADurb.Bin444]
MLYAVACDHAGLPLKAVLIEELLSHGYRVEDLGTSTAESVDYPPYAIEVARKVEAGAADRGLLICGTGLGMALAANKAAAVRAVAVSECFSARMAREHNDANILCLGARVVGAGLAVEILRTWLSAEFQGGRHAQRVQMIMKAGKP